MAGEIVNGPHKLMPLSQLCGFFYPQPVFERSF
jgi:hypothetical protein